MNLLWQMPAVVFAVLAWFSSPPTGLADIAQRESMRRAATQKSDATLTNLGLTAEDVPPSAVSVPAPAAPPATGDAAAKPADDPAGAKADAPKDEAWWRTKIGDLRKAADKNQLAVEALQSRINALQSDSVNLDDPVKQTKARMDLIRAIDELDKTKKQLEADQRAIQDLQTEARRANVPAGWIR